MARQDVPMAGIFCKDSRLCRLWEIQLGFCGVNRTVNLREAPERASDCLLWLVDLDGFPYEDLPDRPEGCRVYGFTQSIELEAKYGQSLAFCFRRPFAMTAFEAVICQDLYGDNMPLAAAQADPPGREISRVRRGNRGDILRVLGDGVVTLEGNPVSLTKQEQAVFDCLWEHRGRAVSKETLRERLSAVPSGDTAGNTPEVYICFLRRKLEKPTGRKLITTVRGVGYMLEDA